MPVTFAVAGRLDYRMDRREFLLASLALPGAASAQLAVSIRAGLIHYIEGEVWVGERRLDPDSVRFESLAVGETLRTRRGKAEIVLGVGRMLRLAPGTELVLLNDTLEAVGLELRSGAAYVTWEEIAGDDGTIGVAIGDTRIEIRRFGVFRFDVSPDLAARVRVYEGKTFIQTSGAVTIVKSKHEGVVAETAEVRRFDREDLDGFDYWSARRVRRVRRLTRAGSRKRRGRRGRSRSPLPGASQRGVPRLGGP